MTSKADKSNAVVLFSGGLDSTVCLYYALKKRKRPIALSFDYSQRHRVELKRAAAITYRLGVEHRVIRLDTEVFLGSSLTEKQLKVPKGSVSDGKIPNTYVPGRNMLFLSFAVSVAEGRGCREIYIGVNALDYSGYPDCRPEFISAFQNAADIGTKAGNSGRKIKIITPLQEMTKKDIILLGKKLNVPFDMTHSCYDPDRKGRPCGKCESCLLREKGFKEALGDES
ncbi:MAG TPA: 7-cyano-7-deazaguanine synthase QueC [Leptospiraceae bacterium]|nr:7-cyano-7-deazaguanine synthase QueC [Leptospiraceae bacterium]